MSKQYNDDILEKCLPKYLEEDLKRLKQGIKDKISIKNISMAD